jgi:hypothetical protein
MNATTKYVVSRTLEDVDDWQNSILLHGDAAAAVAGLKAQSDLTSSVTTTKGVIIAQYTRR